jgi:hypothetical protein
MAQAVSMYLPTEPEGISNSRCWSYRLRCPLQETSFGEFGHPFFSDTGVFAIREGQVSPGKGHQVVIGAHFPHSDGISSGSG